MIKEVVQWEYVGNFNESNDFDGESNRTTQAVSTGKYFYKSNGRPAWMFGGPMDCQSYKYKYKNFLRSLKDLDRVRWTFRDNSGRPMDSGELLHFILASTVGLQSITNVQPLKSNEILMRSKVFWGFRLGSDCFSPN